MTHPDVLVIERFELLPMYRGIDIGAKAIKLLLHHFKNSCGLIMLRVEPYQNTVYYENDKRMQPKKLEVMRYNDFTKDDELAFLKLMAHFTKMGF